MPTEPTPQAFTVDQFCVRNNVGRTTTYAEIKAGRLRAKKVGTKTIIPAKDEQVWRDNLPDLKLDEAQPAAA